MTAKGLGPLPHIAGTRMTAMGRSQTVKNFVAKVNKEDLLLLQELLQDGKMSP
jgi:hypothetical protein